MTPQPSTAKAAGATGEQRPLPPQSVAQKVWEALVKAEKQTRCLRSFLICRYINLNGSVQIQRNGIHEELSLYN